MPDSGRRITFELEPCFEAARGARWLVARLAVGRDVAWDMLPNPTVARSRIGPRALDDLIRHEGPPPRRGNDLILRNLTIAGQQRPDLAVLVDPGITRLKIDGMLGFDFFERFEEVRWNPRTKLVTLLLP